MWPLLLACSEPPPSGDDDDAVPSESTPPVPPGSPVLTVTDGYGDGTYAAGAEVYVWADVDPQAQIVAGWSAGGPGAEWNGPITMPDEDRVLTPTFEAVALPIEERTYPLAGGDRRTLVVPAASPAGVVLYFHGAAYSVDSLRDNAAASIARHLVRASFTVVAVSSESEAAAGAGGWNGSPSDANVDLQNVRALVAALAADGTLPDGVPVVAWGMSSGGIFAHTVGAALPAQTVVAWCAPGDPAALSVTEARTGWYLAANDQVFRSSVTDAQAFQAELEARAVATDLYVHPATPLYDQRFERIAGIDAARSAAIAEAVRATGAVDAADRWTVPGSAVDVDLDGLTPEQVAAVNAEIEVMAADHELYDDVAARMVAFVAAGR